MLPLVFLSLLGLVLTSSIAFAQALPALATCTVVDQSAGGNWFRDSGEVSVRRDPDGTILSLSTRPNNRLHTRDFTKTRAGVSYEFEMLPVRVAGLVMASFQLITAEANRHVRIDLWVSSTVADQEPTSGARHSWVRMRC